MKQWQLTIDNQVTKYLEPSLFCSDLPCVWKHLKHSTLRALTPLLIINWLSPSKNCFAMRCCGIATVSLDLMMKQRKMTLVMGGSYFCQNNGLDKSAQFLCLSKSFRQKGDQIYRRIRYDDEAEIDDTCDWWILPIQWS